MNRQDKVAQALAAAGPVRSADLPALLCAYCVDEIGVSGAAFGLIHGERPAGTLALAGGLVDVAEELQFALGEGPCVDSIRSRAPVVEPDLVAGGPARWPAFAPGAMKAGIASIFAFPLQVGAVNLATLDLVSDATGMLEADQYDDALAVADIATRSLLLAERDRAGVVEAAMLGERDESRLRVHQATGMVAAQLNVPVDRALVALRERAEQTGRSLYDLAGDVVARRLRLGDEGAE